MCDEAEIKKKMAAMLGAGVMATALTAVPAAIDPVTGSLTASAAWAQSGESGEGGESESESGESGESESESGESGDAGENESESGESGESGENESGENGNINNSGSPRSIPSRFGRVVSSSVTDTAAEIRYSDGWKERISRGRYQLRNARNRTVVSRKARSSDYRRIGRPGKNKSRKPRTRTLFEKLFRRKN